MVAHYIWRDSNKLRFANQKSEYYFKLSYTLSSHWEPFVQVGNVKYLATSEQRHTRYRIGIKFLY